jgi:hypothetical protein
MNIDRFLWSSSREVDDDDDESDDEPSPLRRSASSARVDVGAAQAGSKSAPPPPVRRIFTKRPPPSATCSASKRPLTGSSLDEIMSSPGVTGLYRATSRVSVSSDSQEWSGSVLSPRGTVVSCLDADCGEFDVDGLLVPSPPAPLPSAGGFRPADTAVAHSVSVARLREQEVDTHCQEKFCPGFLEDDVGSRIDGLECTNCTSECGCPWSEVSTRKFTSVSRASSFVSPAMSALNSYWHRAHSPVQRLVCSIAAEARRHNEVVAQRLRWAQDAALGKMRGDVRARLCLNVKTSTDRVRGVDLVETVRLSVDRLVLDYFVRMCGGETSFGVPTTCTVTARRESASGDGGVSAWMTVELAGATRDRSNRVVSCARAVFDRHGRDVFREFKWGWAIESATAHEQAGALVALEEFARTARNVRWAAVPQGDTVTEEEEEGSFYSSGVAADLDDASCEGRSRPNLDETALPARMRPASQQTVKRLTEQWTERVLWHTHSLHEELHGAWARAERGERVCAASVARVLGKHAGSFACGERARHLVDRLAYHADEQCEDDTTRRTRTESALRSLREDVEASLAATSDLRTVVVCSTAPFEHSCLRVVVPDLQPHVPYRRTGSSSSAGEGGAESKRRGERKESVRVELSRQLLSLVLDHRALGLPDNDGLRRAVRKALVHTFLHTRERWRHHAHLLAHVDLMSTLPCWPLNAAQTEAVRAAQRSFVVNHTTMVVDALASTGPFWTGLEQVRLEPKAFAQLHYRFVESAPRHGDVVYVCVNFALHKLANWTVSTDGRAIAVAPPCHGDRDGGRFVDWLSLETVAEQMWQALGQKRSEKLFFRFRATSASSGRPVQREVTVDYAPPSGRPRSRLHVAARRVLQTCYALEGDGDDGPTDVSSRWRRAQSRFSLHSVPPAHVPFDPSHVSLFDPSGVSSAPVAEQLKGTDSVLLARRLEALAHVPSVGVCLPAGKDPDALRSLASDERYVGLATAEHATGRVCR